MADATSRRSDVLVIGGGLAGTAAAILLARAGRAVTLLERTCAAHHKVCGEFLSAEALHDLDHLGIDPWLLGATPIRTLRIEHRGSVREQPLPFAAASLTRFVLDDALLARAREAGVCVLRGQAVQTLVPVHGGWQSTTATGMDCAPAVVLATGKHDLHGHARTRPAARSPLRHDGLMAFKQYFQLSPEHTRALHGAVQLTTFPGGYCGLQPVQDGTANLALLVRQDVYRSAGSSWPGLIDHVGSSAPRLAAALQGARELLPKPLALSHIPYGYRRQRAPDGLYSVGDQAAVIPSFSGDGMSIALRSGILAAQSILAGTPSQLFQQSLARSLRPPVALATLVSRALIHLPSLAVYAPATLLRHIALRTRLPPAFVSA